MRVDLGVEERARAACRPSRRRGRQTYFGERGGRGGGGGPAGSVMPGPCRRTSPRPWGGEPRLHACEELASALAVRQLAVEVEPLNPPRCRPPRTYQAPGSFEAHVLTLLSRPPIWSAEYSLAVATVP